MVARKAAAAPAAKKTTPAAAKKATPAATKATPARARKAAAAPVEDDEPDLLAAMNDTSSKATSTSDDDEDFDLLSELTEEEGESWMPWDDEDQPEGIQGKVVAIGEVEKEQRFGGGTAVMVQLSDKDNPDQIWSVRGYSTVLGNQLEREIEKGLAVGDFMAIRYWGEKENKKKDNTYKNFTTASKHRK